MVGSLLEACGIRPQTCGEIIMGRKQQPRLGKAPIARSGSQIDSGVVLRALQESGDPLRLDALLGWIGAGSKSKKKLLDILKESG